MLLLLALCAIAANSGNMAPAPQRATPPQQATPPAQATPGPSQDVWPTITDPQEEQEPGEPIKPPPR